MALRKVNVIAFYGSGIMTKVFIAVLIGLMVYLIVCKIGPWLMFKCGFKNWIYADVEAKWFSTVAAIISGIIAGMVVMIL